MQVNLAAAAQAVTRTDRGHERGGALMVWQALTGLDNPAEAYALAVDYADHPDGEAALLLTDGAVLVTLWRDGSAVVAHRDYSRWGIPSPLAVAP